MQEDSDRAASTPQVNKEKEKQDDSDRDSKEMPTDNDKSDHLPSEHEKTIQNSETELMP